ncbi:MAG: enoyl-CoA hydratase/isomerase family protein [Pseudomonadota bacterium]
MSDVLVRRVGATGRITLNRPDALNAVTLGMVREITRALAVWEEDKDVRIVVIDATGDRAFAAGGDIVALYEAGKSGAVDDARSFWAEEYALNERIARFGKPFVAMMSGIVMGGGVGVSAHGSHRFVTDTTTLAMPECSIGLVPDAGGSYLLARSPGAFGRYAGLTGARLKAGDTIYSGFADAFIPRGAWPEAVVRLEETSEPDAALKLTEPCEPETDAKTRAEIDKVFAAEGPVRLAHALESASGPWARAAAKRLRAACPLSIHVADHMVAAARGLTIADALRAEYRFVWRAFTEGDFLEGIRAAVIDKDRRPRWAIPTLEDVTEANVAKMCASLGPNELQLFGD